MTSRSSHGPHADTGSERDPSAAFPLRLGISRCLLGDPVRYDGGHTRDRFLTDVLGPHVEWVPVCPEVEAGFGTPREAMRLVDDVEHPRLITIRSSTDQTETMRRAANARVRDLRSSNLSGYVFKSHSPSCGTRRVRVYDRYGRLLGRGTGLFAEAFHRAFPLIPVEEEGRLQDRTLRERFLERVFGYHRWQACTVRRRLTRGALVFFHATHKYLILAHSRRHYQRLGQLVAHANRLPIRQFADAYGRLFMEALAVNATVRTHVNVLRHVVGHFTGTLDSTARRDLHETLTDYHKGLVPLSVPITLIRHYVRVLDVPYLRDQVYLAPHPKALALRHHV